MTRRDFFLIATAVLAAINTVLFLSDGITWWTVPPALLAITGGVFALLALRLSLRSRRSRNDSDGHEERKTAA